MKRQLVAVKCISAVISALPLPLCYALARLVGTMRWLTPSARKDAVLANLAVVYNTDIGDPRVRRNARRVLRHAMLNYVDLFRMGRADAPRSIRAIRTPSMAPIDDALALGKGLILVSAHLGNFDTVVNKLALRGDRVFIPVEQIEPPELLQYFCAQRARFGTQIEPIGPNTFKQMAAHVRAGGIVVIVSDRDIQGSGHVVQFFGREVSLPNAAILLSLRTGAPVLGAFGYRHRDNSISAHPSLAPLHFTGTGKRNLRLEMEAGMRALAAMIEREIRQDPGQWVVQQPVFAATSQSVQAAEQRAAQPAGERSA